MRRTARAVIDLDALRHNLGRVRAAAPGSRIMTVVKADAYGHGMLRVVAALDGLCEAFAVTCVDEGIALRDMGVAVPVLVLQGFRDEAELAAASAHRLSVTVYQDFHLRLLETARLSVPVPVWIKLDTGMHRLGFPASLAASIHSGLSKCANVSGAPDLMTHFARADEFSSSSTKNQCECFDSETAGLCGERSLANSAAILAHPDTHREWVRPGIMLYGASPFADVPAAHHGLRPVMTVTAPIIAVNALRSGDAVGYGGAYVCETDMRVGIVAIGYGDGYPRHVPSGTPVLLRGRRVPVVGRVSMDLLAVDLTGLPEMRPGDEATLWGEGLPVDEIAAAAGTIGYELLCAMGGRLWESTRG